MASRSPRRSPCAGPGQLQGGDRRRLKQPEDSDWLMFRRTYDGWATARCRRSPPTMSASSPGLGDVDRTVEGHQAPPMVNNGVMFVATPGNQVLAIDAKTGGLLWRFRRPAPEDQFLLHPTSRGVGLWGDKVFLAASDSTLVALDAKTGKQVWATKYSDYEKGYYASLAPWSSTARY